MAKSARINQNAINKYFGERIVERTPRKKQARRYYLIVCEGEKTEPNYFESLKNKLPKEMVKRIIIKGEGKNCMSLLKDAESKVEERYSSGLPPFYHVWLVFDKDSFDDFDETINAVKEKSKTKQHWHSAWSNEAFELWYLLHFETHFAGISRTEYQEKIEKCMKNIGVSRKYKKNAEDMYDILKPLQENAIKNAKIALKSQKNKGILESQMNPATTVHLLVEKLISYIE